MSDNWMNTYGDTVGLPGLAATGLMGLKAARGLGRYGANAIRGIAGAPLAGASAFLYGMGDLKGNATTAANAGEQDLYIKGPDGKYIPNPNNPLISPPGSGSPMSPMPASYPFPTLPNGMNPANPSVLSLPSAPPQGAAGNPGAAATPSPSPLPPGLPGTPPTLGPLSAPLLDGSTGGWPASGGSATAEFDPPLPPGARPTSFSPPDFYNGPGSSSFGAGDQPPGGISALMGLMKGGTDAANVAQRSNGLIPRLASLLSNNGQAFAPGWRASNAWYNN